MVRMASQENPAAMMMMSRRRSTTRGSPRVTKIIMIWTAKLRPVLIIGRVTSMTNWKK